MSSLLCMKIKLYILTSVLLLSMAGYGCVEYMTKTNRSFALEQCGQQPSKVNPKCQYENESYNDVDA